MLRPLVARWLAARGRLAFVGADQFIYWKQHDAHCRVAPDVYVLPGIPPTTHVSSWKIWESGIAPSFCLEVVSRDWRKDYCDAPDHYAAAGAAELVVFDPAWRERSDGLRWQVYRRLARRGFVRVGATNGDRVRVRTLGCWLRAVGGGTALRLRLATGARGDDLLPTGEEAAWEAERVAREAEQVARAAEQIARAAEQTARAAEQTARADAEAERTAKGVALARITELEAKVGARSRKRRRS